MDLSNRRLVLWLLLAFPFFKPAVFAELEWAAALENIYNVWRMAAAGVIAVLYVIDLLKRKKLSPVMLGLWIYEISIMIATVMNGRNYFHLLNVTATMVSFCMLVEMTVREDPKLCLDVLTAPVAVQIFINFVLLLCFPQGIVRGGGYNNAFNYLSIDNQLAAFMIPHVVVVCLRSTMKKGDLDFFAYYTIVICMLTLLLVWSATGMVTMAAIMVFLFFFYKRRGQFLFNFLTAVTGMFGMFFGIIVFRLQNIFAFFVEDVLHKGLSFTGRTVLWDIARDMFLEKPFLGHGLGLQGRIYRVSKGRYYPAHSVIYEILVQGGICAMAGFMTMLLSAGKQLLIYRKHPYAALLSAGLLVYGVVGSMESYVDSNSVLWFALIFLSYYVGTLIYEKETPAAGAH